MKTDKIENGLALLGVLIVLFAVSSAANTSLDDYTTILKGDLKIEAPAAN